MSCKLWFESEDKIFSDIQVFSDKQNYENLLPIHSCWINKQYASVKKEMKPERRSKLYKAI